MDDFVRASDIVFAKIMKRRVGFLRVPYVNRKSWNLRIFNEEVYKDDHYFRKIEFRMKRRSKYYKRNIFKLGIE